MPETLGNPCYVVNGVTTILLDKRSAHIQQRVYDAIAVGLEDSNLIQRFASGVVRAEFLRSLGESLTSNPSSDLEDAASVVPVAATIVVAAASVSIILGSMFWYGLMRRELRQHPDPSIRYKSRRYAARSLMVVVHGIGLDPPRIHRRFSRLYDISHGSKLEDMNAFENDTDDPGQVYDNPTPSIIWSVSDITSDSGSVQSDTSVTGSRLERIDEEEGDESDECQEVKCFSRKREEHLAGVHHRLVDDGHSVSDAELVALVPMDISSLDDDLDEELQGCRFIRDEIETERVEVCLSSRSLSTVMYDVEDFEIRVGEDDSIFSFLSSSDNDDDDFHESSPGIQDEAGLESVAEGVLVITAKAPENRSHSQNIALHGYNGLAEHEPLTQILCGNLQSSHGAPITTHGGEGEDSSDVRSLEPLLQIRDEVKVFVTPPQCPPTDKTSEAEVDSLDRSIASSTAFLPVGILPQVFLTDEQDPLEDKESSAANDRFELTTARSSLEG